MTLSIKNQRYRVLEYLGFSGKLNGYVAITFSSPGIQEKPWGQKTSIAIKPVGEKQWAWMRDRMPKAIEAGQEQVAE